MACTWELQKDGPLDVFEMLQNSQYAPNLALIIINA